MVALEGGAATPGAGADAGGNAVSGTAEGGGARTTGGSVAVTSRARGASEDNGSGGSEAEDGGDIDGIAAAAWVARRDIDCAAVRRAEFTGSRTPGGTYRCGRFETNWAPAKRKTTMAIATSHRVLVRRGGGGTVRTEARSALDAWPSSMPSARPSAAAISRALAKRPSTSRDVARSHQR